MEPTKEQIRRYMSQTLQRSLDAYALLEDKQWKKKASSDWTAKDYLAHLVIAQEEEANHLIGQALAGEPGKLPGFDGREAINGYNEGMLASVRELPVSELLGRLKAAFEESLRILDGLSESDLDKPASSPAWDRPGKVRDLFLGSYLHLPGHYQDIRRVAKKKLPHWVDASTEEEVHFQMDRIFHYMPLIYWSDRGGDMKATYLFTMEGTGGGQWAVIIGDGKAETQSGAPESFDMEFRTKPELWIDLSTNDLNPMWAITTRKIHLDGNTGLAMKLGSLFQVSG
ncbi:MAG: SCP2 sterol-binding domain-containing protein [Dehalococcoidia bacterium]